MMRHGRCVSNQLLIILTMTLFWMHVGAAQSASSIDTLETVKGVGCYAYGDNETPSQAKRAAMTIAQEQAVRSYRVFVQSQSRVKNFQLEDDVIQTATAAILQNIEVQKEEKKGQEICIEISAKLSPVSLENLINQKVNAQEISQEVQAAFVPDQQAFGLRVWTNKTDGTYREGENLIIYMESERDAYVKIDYFQADGSVVHLVPNMFRGQAVVKAGRRYAFGDVSGPDGFVITGPFGAEAIKVIASPVPFAPQANASGIVSESRGYLNGLREGLRGIKIVSSAAVALQTLSTKVEAYKAERGLPSGNSSVDLHAATGESR